MYLITYSNIHDIKLIRYKVQQKYNEIGPKGMIYLYFFKRLVCQNWLKETEKILSSPESNCVKVFKPHQPL